jgi:hypothetical protein
LPPRGMSCYKGGKQSGPEGQNEHQGGQTTPRPGGEDWAGSPSRTKSGRCRHRRCRGERKWRSPWPRWAAGYRRTAIMYHRHTPGNVVGARRRQKTVLSDMGSLRTFERRLSMLPSPVKGTERLGPVAGCRVMAVEPVQRTGSSISNLAHSAPNVPAIRYGRERQTEESWAFRVSHR